MGHEGHGRGKVGEAGKVGKRSRDVDAGLVDTGARRLWLDAVVVGARVLKVRVRGEQARGPLLDGGGVGIVVGRGRGERLELVVDHLDGIADIGRDLGLVLAGRADLDVDEAEFGLALDFASAGDDDFDGHFGKELVSDWDLMTLRL